MENTKIQSNSLSCTKKDLVVINQYKEYGDAAFFNASDRFSKIVDLEEKNSKKEASDDIDQFQDISIDAEIDTNKNLVESFEQHLTALRSVDQIEKVFADFFQQIGNYKKDLNQYIQTCMNRNLDGQDQKQTGQHQQTLEKLTKEIKSHLESIKKAKIFYANDPNDNLLNETIKKFLQSDCFNDFMNFLTQAAKPVLSYAFGQNDTDDIKFSATFKMIFEQLKSVSKMGFKDDVKLAQLIKDKKKQAMKIIKDRVKLNGISLIAKEFVKNFESLYLVVDAVLGKSKEIDFKNHNPVAGLFTTCLKLNNLKVNIENLSNEIKNATENFEKDTSVENLGKIADEIQKIMLSKEIAEMINLIGSVTKDEDLTPELMVKALEEGKLGSTQPLSEEDNNKKIYIIESKTRLMQVVTRIVLIAKCAIEKMEDMPKEGSTAHKTVEKALESIQPKISEVNDYPKLLDALLTAPALILQLKLELRTAGILQNNSTFNENLKNLYEKFCQLKNNSSANFYKQEIWQAIKKINKQINIAMDKFLEPKPKLQIFFQKSGIGTQLLEELNIDSKQKIKDKFDCLRDRFEMLSQLISSDSENDFKKYIKEKILFIGAENLIVEKQGKIASGSNSNLNDSDNCHEIKENFVNLFHGEKMISPLKIQKQGDDLNEDDFLILDGEIGNDLDSNSKNREEENSHNNQKNNCNIF